MYIAFPAEASMQTIRFTVLKFGRRPDIDALHDKSGPVTRHGGALGERRYSFYSFLT
jgi:hypothetical protein